MPTVPMSYWLGFHLVLAAALIAEIFLSARTRPSMKRAVLWTAIWVSLAAAFAAFVFLHMGRVSGVEFLTGYLVEQSLSVDNLFLFIILFRAFRIHIASQRRVLVWGVLGAVVMRGAFVAAGFALLRHFAWTTYLFSAILIFAAVRLLAPEKGAANEAPAWLSWLNRLSPVSLDQSRFFTIEQGRRMITVLTLALIAIELTDLVFAVDSIPAVLSVTRHPFIAYTSNVLAVMGLRSLYFILAGVLKRLRLLRYGLAAVLAFVAAKMLLADVFPLSPLASLGAILAILAITVLTSMLTNKQVEAGPRQHT